MKGYELRTGVEQALQKLNSHLGLKNITLEWDGLATTASITSSREISLPNITDDSDHTKAVLRKYVGYILHELLHHKYTDFSKRASVQYVSMLHNALEDAWIERIAIANELVPNVRDVLSDLINGMVDESLTTVSDWSDVSIYPFALAIYARGYCKRVPLAKGLEPIFETAFKRIDTCKSSDDTLALAEWVYAQLKLPNQPGNEPGNKPNNEPGNKPGNESSNESSDESSNESSDESTDESSNDSNNVADIDPGERKQVRENDYASDVEPQLDGKDNALCVGERAPKAEAYHTQGGYKFSTDVQVPGRLRFEVRRMFENSAREEFQFNRKSGQLNTGSLYSIGYNDKLFKRHHETAGIESAVVICLDVSSSMFEDNNRLIRVAVPTCAVLTDTLKRAGVNVAIITYGTYPSLLKGFNAPLKQALERLSDVGRGGGTDDFSALRQAHLMLHKRAEQRKVAFVITDGIGMYKFTSDQVASGERLGITTVGVGIMHDVSNTFSKSVTVHRPQDLATACFNQIKLV